MTANTHHTKLKGDATLLSSTNSFTECSIILICLPLIDFCINTKITIN